MSIMSSAQMQLEMLHRQSMADQQRAFAGNLGGLLGGYPAQQPIPPPVPHELIDATKILTKPKPIAIGIRQELQVEIDDWLKPVNKGETK